MSKKHITDPQIITMFDNWKNHTGQYLDLQLDKVEFDEVYIFKDVDSNKYLRKITGVLSGQNGLDNSFGDTPVFSGSSEIVAHIASDYLPNKLLMVNEENYVSFASNGENAGSNWFIHDVPFYVSGDRSVFKCSEALYSKYFYYSCLDMKQRYGLNWGTKATMTRLKDIVAIPIPQEHNHYSSYDIQVMMAEFIEFFIDKVLNMAKFIQDESANIKTYLLNTIFDNEQKYITDKPTLELFELWKKIYKKTDIKLEQIEFAPSSITSIVKFINGSEFPKNYVKEKGNQGCIPLISAGTKIDIMGYIKSLIGNNPNKPSEHYVYNTTKNKWNNVTHYFGKDYYTLTADGVYGGTLIRRKQSDYPNGFYTTNVCKVLDFINENIVTDYFLYAYQSQFLKSEFGFATKAKNDNLKLIVISIPQDYNNYSSYDIQKTIAEFIYDVSEKNSEFAKNVETYIETIKLPFLNAIFG